MENLLDHADALLLTAGEDGPSERPNFKIPTELAHFAAPQEFLQLLDNPSKGGKGWFTNQPVKAGTVVMVSKPIAWALDVEADLLVDDDMDDSDSDAELPEHDSPGNDLVLLEVLKLIKENPSIWFEKVSTLYPRDDTVTSSALPAWNCQNEGISSKFEALIEDFQRIPELRGKSHEIQKRLPLIIRYNVLSVETCPELLSYPGPTGYSLLSGVGLYHWPSFFNHDARPNLSRYAVGDVMWLVANQDIPMGQELCISYLEHDVLCENAGRRNCMLTLDFKERDDPIEPTLTEDGPETPVVDSDVQMELMGMPPFERLEAIDQLTQQAAGEALPEGEQTEDDGMNADVSTWFQCDMHNLRILKAITLESLGQSEKALGIWEECVQFAETSMPPHDETSIVMRVQAALCSWNLKDGTRAKQHASVALNVHDLMFGGGVRRFRRRYLKEFSLNIRKTNKEAEKVLWPYIR